MQDAVRVGLPVHERSMSLADLKEHMLTGQWLMIALVDKQKLCGPKLMSADIVYPQFQCQPLGYTGAQYVQDPELISALSYDLCSQHSFVVSS